MTGSKGEVSPTTPTRPSAQLVTKQIASNIEDTSNILIYAQDAPPTNTDKFMYAHLLSPNNLQIHLPAKSPEITRPSLSYCPLSGYIRSVHYIV